MPTAAEAAQLEESLARERLRKAESSRTKTFEEIMSGINEAEQKRKQKQQEEASAMEAANQALKVNVSGEVAKPLSLHKGSKKRKHSSTNGSKKSSKSSGKTQEQQALKLFTPVVIGVLSKYARKTLDRDQFKKRAKELSHLLVDKEKKSSRWETEDYTTLTPEKEKKLRNYCKDWVAKLVARKSSSRSDSHSSKSRSPSKPVESTPASQAQEEKDDEAMEKEMADLMAEMNGVEEEENDDEEEEESYSPELFDKHIGGTTPAGPSDDLATQRSLDPHNFLTPGSASAAKLAPPPPPPAAPLPVDGEASMGDSNAEATMTLAEADRAVDASQAVQDQNGATFHAGTQNGH